MNALMPHGACYLWDRNLVVLHVASDVGIAIAYLCLPIFLWYFIHKRHDVPFSWLFAMFGSFILSCGTTHVLSVWTLWHPDYLVEGLVKAITALISLGTAIALYLNLPQVLALPSPNQMREKEQQLEAALAQEREINALRRQIVSTVSHECRTPLTAILSSVELIERYENYSDRAIRHFNKIKRKIAYLISLVDDALMLDKAESGKLEFQPTEIDAIAHCENVLRELGSNDHRLEIEAEGEAIGLFDVRLLTALLTNLVYNAIKYSEAGSVVTVRLKNVQRVFELEVQDYGVGIPEYDLPRIFESYFRGSNVEGISGTGVGLAIVQQCVALHGGTIEVESEVNVGTTFKVFIPLRQNEG